MSILKDNICQQMKSTLDNLITDVSSVYNTASGLISTIRKAILTLKYSSLSEIQSAQSSIDDSIDDNIPNFNSNDINEMTSIINSCAFLRSDKKLGNPTTLIRSMNSTVKNSAKNSINDIVNDLAEFSVAKLMDALLVKYSDDYKFLEIIPKIYQLTDCIDSICSSVDISSSVETLIYYTTELYLLNDGNFDKTRFFNDLNLTDSQKTNLNIALESYKNIRDKANDKIQNGIDFAKSLI